MPSSDERGPSPAASACGFGVIRASPGWDRVGTLSPYCPRCWETGVRDRERASASEPMWRPASPHEAAGGGAVRLEKYHGLGNDFLILLDTDGTQPIDAELTRRVCDRHRGVGADGLIRVTGGREGADLTMELRNADGGEAEISGNGIRCVGLAAVDGKLAA